MPSRELELSPHGLANRTGTPDGTSVHGSLKKHKQLPHPRRNGSGDYSTPTSNVNSTSASRGLSLETDVTSPTSTRSSTINSSPRTLKHTSRRIIGSIDLPPTPPAHSRNSSNDANIGATPQVVTTNGFLVESPACSTPVNVQSPPTPDFTPPRPRRVEAVQNQSSTGLPREGEKRRDMGSRNDSMNTTTSFVTAREELESDHDGSSTIKGGDIMTLDGTDYAPEDHRMTPQPRSKMRSLGLGLEGLEDGSTRQRTPTQGPHQGLRKKFSFEDDFDGDHSPKSQRVQARDLANPILSRNVTIARGKTRRKPYNLVDQDTPTKQPSKAKEHRRRHTEQDITSARREVREVLDDTPVLPTNATRHLERHGVHDQNEFGKTPEIKATPRNSQEPEDMARKHWRSHIQPDNLFAIPRAKQAPVLADPHDVRKFSHGSSRSNSTVDAVVVIQPQQLKARRTLRRKERMGSLRDFSPSFASRVPGAEKEYHIPAQRLRHKSIDLSQRPMAEMSVPEKTRRVLDDQVPQQPRNVSRPLPPKREDKEETEEEGRIRRMNSFVYSGSEPWEVMDSERYVGSRQVSEQTVVLQEHREPRSRQVSEGSEQTVIEHPRESPLPEVPRERDTPTSKPQAQATPIAAVPPSQESLQSRPPVTLQDDPAPRPRRFSIERKPVPQRPRMDSTTSNGTVTTDATEKARSRKQLLADGVIPVVIVPRRASSLKEQSQPPSLRSSKQASRASSTAPLSTSAGTNIPGAWPGSYPSSLLGQRRYSDGAVSTRSQKMTPKEDGLVRSMDTGPPAIPVRRSSMSAPTTPYGSRNVSRSNSLTADSLRRHNEDQAYKAVSYAGTLDPEQTAPRMLDSQQSAPRTVSQTIQQRRDENRDSGVGYGVGIATHSHSVRIEEPELEHQRDSRQRSTHLSVDTNGDPLFGQRLSAQVTPFSAKSDVTGASHSTALEVAEARQVDIFSHQNTSVQLVDQEPPSSSASESIKLRQKSNARRGPGGRPTTSSSTGTAIRPDRPRLESREKYSSTSLTTPSSNANGAPSIGNLVPASPPQTGVSDGMTHGVTNSPLINPRQPPAPPAPPVGLAARPPAFKIIPPTPAELAAQEEASKQLGWEPPRDQNGDISRPPRRNWSLRGVGGLVRSLSLGRRNSRKGRNVRDVDVGSGVAALIDDHEKPAEEGKLHPFWRPANYRDEEEDCNCDECREYWAVVDSEARAAKRSSTTDKPQRPAMPRRTTSQMSQVSKRLKKTFAILPLAGVETTKDKSRDDGYNVSYATARRTIKRSGSGNLKVVNRVGNVSKESLKLQEYLNRSRRERSFRRTRFNSLKRKVSASGRQARVNGEDMERKREPQTLKEEESTGPLTRALAGPLGEEKRKRFSWVGGSTDSPASKYPPAVRYPPQSSSATPSSISAPLKRTFSLPGRSRKGPEDGTSYPPRVNVEWLSLGGLTRRFSERSEKRKEEKREGLRRTISAPRGVRDGVEEVLTSRQRADARRERYRREAGVQTEDFGRG